MTVPSLLRSVVSAALLSALTASIGSAAQSPQPGIDPNKEPLVGAFSCYFNQNSDAYATPSFTLEILPGRNYRTPFGEGQFAIDPTETLSIAFTTGPLVNSIESAANFGDWGQSLSFVRPIGAPESYCYQVGPRNDLAQSEFRAKDPQPGSYPCVAEDGSPATNLEILPGRAYSYGGVSGTYTLNVLRRQRDKSSEVDFSGGPFDGRFGFFSGDIATGRRSMSISRTGAPDLDCEVVVAATPAPQFGPVPAPRKPRLPKPVVGMYAAWQVDVLGVCSGLCWTFYTFTPNGYVYTRDPVGSRADAACNKTRPNGLPVCERYKVRGATIAIGGTKSVSFARTPRGLRINGRLYRPVAPLPRGARLTGKYVTQNFFPSPDGGGVVTQRTYEFTPAGRFTRVGFAGVTFNPPLGQPGVSVVASSQGGSAGSYRLNSAQNILELRFDNGVVRRVFAFVPANSGRLPRPKLLHLSDGDYLPR